MEHMATSPLKRAHREIAKGIALDKCTKCGCMRDVVEALCSTKLGDMGKGSSDLIHDARRLRRMLKRKRYECAGCRHCFAAEATNLLHKAMPQFDSKHSRECGGSAAEWPAVPGEYHVMRRAKFSPVAVSTLSSAALADDVASKTPSGLRIVGKTDTENIGVEKVVRNIISNPEIRVLIVAGQESKGHRSGATLLSLARSGVDMRMRVIDSPGRRPILENVKAEEVDAFRRQVSVIDMIGEMSTRTIARTIAKEASKASAASSCGEFSQANRLLAGPPIVEAMEPKGVKLDKAGYFVIVPRPEEGVILVEYYSNDNKLLRTIKGKGAKDVYKTVIGKGWVTELTHAAYLGRELTLAELSVKQGSKYVQDKA